MDCCLGGFVLPFAAKLGYRVPRFDFSVPGVTSMSVDTHKVGPASGTGGETDREGMRAHGLTEGRAHRCSIVAGQEPTGAASSGLCVLLGPGPFVPGRAARAGGLLQAAHRGRCATLV